MNIIQKLIDVIESQAELQTNHNYEIHHELEWRQKVYDFEIQDTYTVKDLIILNALINPYEHGDKLDTYINQVITNILKELKTKENDFKRETKRKDALESVNSKDIDIDEKTLFDFSIDSGLLKKLLNSEQSAKVRECAHLLLKNDWKKQVK